jgi:hypothetical protein
VLAAALAAAAALGACSQPDNTRFPHVVHLTELSCGGAGEPECLSCASCHAPSQRDRAHKLPDASLCETCHRDDAHDVAKVLAVAPERPYGEITFDHAEHLVMSEIRGQCVPCHAGVVRAGLRTIPPMQQCFGCHEHAAEWEKGECASCHLRADLEKTLPQTFLKHDESFARHHGNLSVFEQRLCQSCHTQAECQACHDLSGGVRPEARRPELIQATRVHPGNFLAHHAIEARSEPGRCLSCHTPQTCDGCHVARGVSGIAVDGRNPHPPGWVGNDVTSSDFHGPAARRDLLSCAGCHEQGPATNCIRCHKVGAYGGNPHPRGWKSARGMDSQMCRYCHETA